MWECPCGVENPDRRLTCRGCRVSKETAEQAATDLPPKPIPPKCRFCHKDTPWASRRDEDGYYYHDICKWRSAHPILTKTLTALFYAGFSVWFAWIMYQAYLEDPERANRLINGALTIIVVLPLAVLGWAWDRLGHLPPWFWWLIAAIILLNAYTHWQKNVDRRIRHLEGRVQELEERKETLEDWSEDDPFFEDEEEYGGD